MSRGLRNNNPFNIKLTTIRWKGKVPNFQNRDGTFEQFGSMLYGVRAGVLNILSKIKKGITLKKLIEVYAPSHENDTQGYLSYVERKTGINRFSRLSSDANTLHKLSRAIIDFENGKNLISNQIIHQAIGLLSTKSLATSSNSSTPVLLFALATATGLFFYNKHKKNGLVA